MKSDEMGDRESLLLPHLTDMISFTFPNHTVGNETYYFII